MIRVARNPSEEAAWGVLSKSELVKMREMRELTDLLIVSEEGISFYVHSLVLAAASLKLRNKIIGSTDHHGSSNCKCSSSPIFLSRVSGTILQHVIDYLYEGEVVFSEKELEAFFEACQHLGIDGAPGSGSGDNKSESWATLNESKEQPKVPQGHGHGFGKPVRKTNLLTTPVRPLEPNTEIMKMLTPIAAAVVSHLLFTDPIETPGHSGLDKADLIRPDRIDNLQTLGTAVTRKLFGYATGTSKEDCLLVDNKKSLEPKFVSTMMLEPVTLGETPGRKTKALTEAKEYRDPYALPIFEFEAPPKQKLKKKRATRKTVCIADLVEKLETKKRATLPAPATRSLRNEATDSDESILPPLPGKKDKRTSKAVSQRKQVSIKTAPDFKPEIEQHVEEAIERVISSAKSLVAQVEKKVTNGVKKSRPLQRKGRV